jgi:hypothetical protein
MPKEMMSLIGPLLIVGLIAWRMARHAKGRPVKPGQLWIRPAILALFLCLTFLRPPPLSFVAVLAFIAAAAVGLGLGYLLASHQHLSVDKASGAITSRLSPYGMLLFLAVFAARFGVRMMVHGAPSDQPFAAPPPSVLLYTDGALILLTAMVGAQAWEIWRRAKALVESVAAEPSGVDPEI